MISDAEDNIWFRQSWLDTFMRCPNRGRLAILRPDLDKLAGDSALLGTGAHAGCETICAGGSMDEAYAAIALAINTEATECGVKWTHKPNEVPQNLDQMRTQAFRCFDAWVEGILPVAKANGWLGEKPEQKFKEVLFTLPDGRTVGITGTADLPCATNDIVDWKSSKRPYKQWDKQRHAIQPTIYGWAATRGGFEAKHYDWPTFWYGVMIRPVTNIDGNYRTELIPIRRTEAHARWAMKQIQAALTMAFTVGVNTEWPMVAEGNFLCSDKWCPWYSMCRGAALDWTDDVKVEMASK